MDYTFDFNLKLLKRDSIKIHDEPCVFEDYYAGCQTRFLYTFGHNFQDSLIIMGNVGNPDSHAQVFANFIFKA